jgi:hypothetical protein
MDRELSTSAAIHTDATPGTVSGLLLRLRTVDLPVFGKRQLSFLYLLDGLVFLFGAFTPNVGVTVFSTVNFKIEITGVGGFMSLDADKLNVIALNRTETAHGYYGHDH